MDPKQTTPQGANPAGGKEGQNGATPVFSFTGSSTTSSSPLAGPSVTSPNEPGTLGADTLSTGANVSRTMDSLNNRDQATHGGLLFAKHRFDKIDPKTGDILLTPDEEPKKKGFFAGLFGGGRRKQAPESVSMVENRHKDVVIPEQYQNPGKKKRKKDMAAQPVQAQAPDQPTPTTAQPTAAQSTPAPTQPVIPPTQPVTSTSSQPVSTPAPTLNPTPTPAAPRKSRVVRVIAIVGIAVVAIAFVAAALLTNILNNNKKSGYQKTSDSSNTSNNGASSTTTSESSVRELANVYINTVLFNSSSKLTTTAPYFTDKTYYLKDILLGQLSSEKTIAEKQEFLKNILELYESFSSALDSSIYADYPTTIATIDGYGNNLRSYVDYYVNPKTDDSTSYTTEEENLAINNIIIGCWTITKNLDNPIKSNVDSLMYSSETNGNGVSQ